MSETAHKFVMKLVGCLLTDGVSDAEYDDLLELVEARDSEMRRAGMEIGITLGGEANEKYQQASRDEGHPGGVRWWCVREDIREGYVQMAREELVALDTDSDRIKAIVTHGEDK